MAESWNQTDIGTRLGETLIQLLKDRSMDEISVKDICSEAGINRTTFYNYFDDKYQLRDAVMKASTEVFVEKFQNRVSEIQQHSHDLLPEQYLISDEILVYYLELVREYQDVFCSFAMRHGKYYSEEQYRLLVDTIVLPMLRHYGIDDSRQADYMTAFYIGAIHSVVLAWIKHSCEDSVEQIASIIRTCLHIPEKFFP